MADITDKYLSRDIDAQIKALEGQGKSLSTSKSLAKLYDDRKKLLAKGGVFGSGYSSPSHFYRTQYKDYLGERERLMDALGIPDLRNTMSGITSNMMDVEGRLEALPTDVRNEARGFNVNAAQRRAIEAQRSNPLVNQLSNLGRSMERTGTQLRFQEGELTDRLSIYADFQARQATGFDQQRAFALGNYLRKIQRQEALSDREWQQAADLAKLEKKYDLIRRNELAKIQATPTPLDQLETLQGLGLIQPAYAQGGGGGGGDLNQEFEKFGVSGGGGGSSWDTGTSSSILNFIPNAINSIRGLIGI